MKLALAKLSPQKSAQQPPVKYPEACINKAANVILQIKNEYNNLYPKGKFVAVLMPFFYEIQYKYIFVYKT